MNCRDNYRERDKDSGGCYLRDDAKWCCPYCEQGREESSENREEEYECEQIDSHHWCCLPQCPICYEVLTRTDSVARFPCGHMYHHDCARLTLHNLSGPPRCPQCNLLLNEYTDIRVQTGPQAADSIEFEWTEKDASIHMREAPHRPEQVFVDDVGIDPRWWIGAAATIYGTGMAALLAEYYATQY